MSAGGVWFLSFEENEPLGQVYRRAEEVGPIVGAKLTDGPRWRSVEIIGFEELRSTCEMRRFKVVVRRDAGA